MNIRKKGKRFIVVSESIKEASAYWISPSGKIYDVRDKHINNIISNPDMFGYTKDEIEKIYKKYKEPMGLEGKAREEIMKDLINKGWIRVRFNKKRQQWIIQLNKLDKKRKDIMYRFANEVIKKSQWKYTDFFITQNSGLSLSHSAVDVANDVLYEKIEKKQKRFILIVG